MADILDHKIILDAHECEQGQCPVCDGDNIEYGACETEDTLAIYPWSCNTCGAEGAEVGEVQFAGYDLHRGCIPEQVDALFVSGEIRTAENAKEDARDRGRPIEDAPIVMLLNARGVPDEECVLADARRAEWIGLPTTWEVLNEFFERLDITGDRHNKWVACGLDNNPDCISWKAASDMIPKVSARNIDEVNYLTSLLENMVIADKPKLEALVEAGIHIENTADVINLIHNLDNYEFLPGITSHHRYAQYLAGNEKSMISYYTRLLEMPESTASRVVVGGQFTSQGFFRYPAKRFEKVYDGKNVPEQYRLSPQPPTSKEKAAPKRDDGAR